MRLCRKLQIISQNYVVWNLHTPVGWFVPVPVANYITKLRGLKPQMLALSLATALKLQIISQNYVVWNPLYENITALNDGLQIISQNYVVWNFPPENWM